MTRVMIVGGTGSLGSALLRRLSMDSEISISVFSRDEHKQARLKREFPKVEFYLGDIRDPSSIDEAIVAAYPSRIFHVAALKHVDLLEHNVSQCIQTNLQGTINLVRASMRRKIPHLIFSSTDKAVDPINAYGYSKALAEKYLYSHNTITKAFPFASVYRWGNVVGSQGSIIPVFIKQLRDSQNVTLTDPEMTRFWLTIEEAVDFMLATYTKASLRAAMVLPQMKAAKVTRVIETLADLMGLDKINMHVVGLRPGEKLHESLVSVHEAGHVNSKDCEQLSDDELKVLLKPLVDQYDQK